MKKPLLLYQQQIQALHKQRLRLDEDFAQVLAEGFRDGYNVVDLLDPPAERKTRVEPALGMPYGKAQEYDL